MLYDTYPFLIYKKQSYDLSLFVFYNVKNLFDYFKSQGYAVRRELRIGYYRADILAFKDNSVNAVELKLRNWKKAIIQAKNYQLGADYVYVAFPLIKSYTIQLVSFERKSQNCLNWILRLLIEKSLR